MHSTTVAGQWFLIEERPIEGLGQAKLMVSAASPSEFEATLMLNNYESNCLRDWLAHRWNAKSLQQTRLFEKDHSKLLVSLAITAVNLVNAKEKFEAWLLEITADRATAAACRK